MSVSQTPVAQASSGGGVVTGWVTATAIVLRGPTLCKDDESRKIVARVAATGVFKIDYMFSPNGTDWYIGKTVSSGVVVVDGGVALYVNSAEMVVDVGYWYKIQAYQSTGGDIDGVYELREYSEGTS